MLDAYLEHADRDAIPQTIHLVLIEKEAGFVDHLRTELNARPLGSTKVEVDLRHGLFAEEFPEAVARLERDLGRMPPTFAFLDPFGLKDNTLDLTSSLAIRRQCEVLAYLPTGFMARLESTREFASGLDNLSGGRDEWQAVHQIEDFEARRLWLRDRFGAVLTEQTWPDPLKSVRPV